MRCVVIFVGAFFAVLNLNVHGDTAWVNLSSGLWREPSNWSFGVPHMNQPVSHIAIGGESKVVTVDPETPATNLVVQRLNISGFGITNTLYLSGVTLEVRGTLEMRAGSALQIADSTLRLPSSDSSFDINAGEVWLQSGGIEAEDVSTRIGRDGGVAVMRIENGAARFGQVLLGRRVSRSGADGTLLLSGGMLEISGNLDVGADTNCTGRILVTGGEMMAAATNFTTAIGEQGNGIMVVSNGVVRFDEVDVGRHGNVLGTLHLAGGSNSVEDLSLGRFPLSTGLVFQVEGDLVVRDALRVGHEGRGEMTISGGAVIADEVSVAGETNTASGLLVIEGGTTVISSNLVVGTAISTGEVVLAGGNLLITNGNLKASLMGLQGTIDLSGSLVTVDHLELPRPEGRLVFHHGFLSSASTVVSNGLPFVVGDGTNAATFHLRGGTHYFQNGLVVASNATLTGCGTIIGNINNQGTIATNCGPSAPILISPGQMGGTFSFSFESQTGGAYTVEFKDALDDSLWNPLTTTNGTGATITITDSPLAPASRFYRVRAQ